MVQVTALEQSIGDVKKSTSSSMQAHTHALDDRMDGVQQAILDKTTLLRERLGVNHRISNSKRNKSNRSSNKRPFRKHILAGFGFGLSRQCFIMRDKEALFMGLVL